MLADLRRRWTKNDLRPRAVPITAAWDANRPRREWLPEWINGSDAFNIFKPEERQDDKILRRICSVIYDQTDDEPEANYALDALPPNHLLLAEFELGSNQEWLTWHDHLRLRPYDVLVNALGVDTKPGFA